MHKKSQQGSAYIVVLTATMLMLLLVAVTLSLTAASRRIGAHRENYVGMYDLAVAGNEQALFLLRQDFYNNRIGIHAQAWAQLLTETPITIVHTGTGLVLDTHAAIRYREIFLQQAMSSISANMGNVFTPAGLYFNLSWGLEATTIVDERTVVDSFSAVTTLRPLNNRVSVITRIVKTFDNTQSIPTVVGASIILVAGGYNEMVLNAHTIEELQNSGVIFPNLPVNGENFVLILDEFTLTMVESLRIAD